MEQVVERLGEVMMSLEAIVAKMNERTAAEETQLEKIVATAVSAREEELERKLARAEATIAQLQSAAASGGRKTASVGRMFAKDGGEGGNAGALDGALHSLSVEQRIAVKAELMRAGLV